MTNANGGLPVGPVDYTNKDLVETIRQTVAVGATDPELKMFIRFCQSTGLNPFKREVWFIKVNGRVQMMTGINGFLAIANSHPQFDGMETTISRDKDGKPFSATCRVWRKDRKYPSTVEAIYSECCAGKGGGVWEQRPSVMLAKVAKAHAIREAFPQELNGIYSEDEIEATEDPIAAADAAAREAKAAMESGGHRAAEDLPTDSVKFYYDLKALAETDRVKITKWMEGRGGAWDAALSVWVMSSPVEKLKQYEVSIIRSGGSNE